MVGTLAAAMVAMFGLLLMNFIVADQRRGRTPILARNSDYLPSPVRPERCILLPNMPNTMKRPVGVTILALVFLWIGCCGAVFFPLVAGFGAFNAPWDGFAGRVIHSEVWLRVTLYLLQTLWYLVYIAYAIIGFGLWKLRAWARTAVFVINLIGAAAGLVVAAIFVRPGTLALAVLAGTVPPLLWMAWYTQRPRVRFAFGAWPTPRGGLSVTEQPPGLSKKGKVWVASGIAATFALYFCCLLFAVESIVRSSEVYQMTLRGAADSPCVAAELGSPLTPGWMVTGGTEESIESGSANLNIPVRGPKGKGSLEMLAEKRDGVWEITSLVLADESGEMQILPADPHSGCH